jgi:hypothetical protein
VSKRDGRVVYRVKPSTCPWCDKDMDAVSAVAGKGRPAKGAVSLCVYCGEWCVFTRGLDLRKPTPDEFLEIGLDERCRRARAIWVRMQAKSPKPEPAVHSRDA